MSRRIHAKGTGEWRGDAALTAACGPEATLRSDVGFKQQEEELTDIRDGNRRVQGWGRAVGEEEGGEGGW